MPFEPIPLRTALDKVYTPASLLQQGQRWDSFAVAFQKQFGVPQQKVSRAPGRVNVIGEVSPTPSPFRAPSMRPCSPTTRSAAH